MTTAQTFVDQLTNFQFNNVFNPYTDACPDHDKADAAAIRRRNLVSVLQAIASAGTDSIWFGRDLGYRGGRRTGLALTDEPHLPVLQSTLFNARVRQATATQPVAERTATEVWKIVRRLPTPPLLWNVFPFHPHEPGEPMSNRRHTAKEASFSEEIIGTLIRWLKPARVITLGKDAAQSLSRFDVEMVTVRHPSYGGQAEFAAGVLSIYGMHRHPEALPLL